MTARRPAGSGELPALERKSPAPGRPSPAGGGLAPFVGAACLLAGVFLASDSAPDARHDGLRAARAVVSCACIGVIAVVAGRAVSPRGGGRRA